MMWDSTLKEAAELTPDPERAYKNLLSFVEENPQWRSALDKHIRAVSLLFSYSQFLSNYCLRYPEILFGLLGDIDVPLTREIIESALQVRLGTQEGGDDLAAPLFMNLIRHFKAEQILRITLRDVIGKTDLVETMSDLSSLADVILKKALTAVRRALTETYGAPEHDAFSVIALGKLGGEELNFSSDVDLIFVYGTEAGETTGVRNPHGIVVNRISNHEYYCKIGETLTRFLALSTEEGIGYRVDLRLRPEGQRGDIALALRGYEMYYESWGRAWERAMLIRARPAAGDIDLGNDFISMARPFVYRKYLDFSAIDEIKKLKTRIDSGFKKGDLKKGYGGIREIEFFAQALQLIYGGKEPLLRERSTLKVLHRLLQKGLIGQEDYAVLSDAYRYLRTVEHRLQQVNDLQTHTLPSGRPELDALGKKMGIGECDRFLADLERRRSRVRKIYDSLFAEKEGRRSASRSFLDEELTDGELKEQLSHTGLSDIDRAARNIRSIKDSIFTFQTLRGRRLLGEALPAFIDAALGSNDPDTALNHLQSFAKLLSTNESYLEIFSRNKELVERLTYVFSQSEYLSRMLMGRPEYLEMFGWQELRRKSRAGLMEDIEVDVSEGNSIQDSVRLLKRTEEIRLGLLFLQKRSSIADVTRGLSKTAEAVLSSCLDRVRDGASELAVIGLGKLGGREITFNSDLDLIFVAPREVSGADTRAAEKLLRMLISYTREGVAYRVDTRLRPDGSKGPLVSSIDGFKGYYSRGAAFWELQALLKARPVAGSKGAGILFLSMAKDAVMSSGQTVRGADILQMRDRIIKELSKEAEGYDIKLGRGGIEDIEFTVQYLQLANCLQHPRLLVQSTLAALRRMAAEGIVEREEAFFLCEAYLFYRTLEGFLRLRAEAVLERKDAPLHNAAEFMGMDPVSFVTMVEHRREKVVLIQHRYLAGP